MDIYIHVCVYEVYIYSSSIIIRTWFDRRKGGNVTLDFFFFVFFFFEKRKEKNTGDMKDLTYTLYIFI